MIQLQQKIKRQKELHEKERRREFKRKEKIVKLEKLLAEKNKSDSRRKSTSPKKTSTPSNVRFPFKIFVGPEFILRGHTVSDFGMTLPMSFKARVDSSWLEMLTRNTLIVGNFSDLIGTFKSNDVQHVQ